MRAKVLLIILNLLVKYNHLNLIIFKIMKTKVLLISLNLMLNYNHLNLICKIMKARVL